MKRQKGNEGEIYISILYLNINFKMWMCNWGCGYFEFGFGAGWFGWSVSIDFVELFKWLFGGE